MLLPFRSERTHTNILTPTLTFRLITKIYLCGSKLFRFNEDYDVAQIFVKSMQNFVLWESVDFGAAIDCRLQACS